MAGVRQEGNQIGSNEGVLPPNPWIQVSRSEVCQHNTLLETWIQGVNCATTGALDPQICPLQDFHKGKQLRRSQLCVSRQMVWLLKLVHHKVFTRANNFNCATTAALALTQDNECIHA